MVSFRYYRDGVYDVSGRTDGSPTSADLGSWTNRRACFPDVWPPAGSFAAEHVIVNGSRSKLMLVGRIDSIVRRCASAVQPVHTACVLKAAGLQPHDWLHDPTPREHACRLVPFNAAPLC